LTMPCVRLRKKKLLDSLLGDRRRWCWGFLGAAVDKVLGRPEIYIDKTGNRQASDHVPRNPCTLRRALGHKRDMWSQGDA
jgi:hypothetical protein